MPAARLRLSGLVARQSPGSGGTRQPVATTVKARRLGCFPRQTLGEPQRQIPLSGNPPAGLAPQGAALGTGLAPQRA
ncbi:MAG: hypothetical protein KME49_28695 [Brasilonema octagenarum HA4186-MV1]|jgi:hypothetical protein|uniref:Uncharacterized protein n=1 Tax=Brasilonema sennae CENA114 TaxID=415709 RepID=A0A856MQM3_9CYAN|nr:hypothetical protein [Brasilonema sennae]MBW4629382.1 hypothetical protein [Brasilonema octagenarum HA4186-MV1]QDL11727.1 hypothetical protein DP114_30950 [Brasilonema sennae CENA114]QDL18108.1 hypothetical protein DP113_31090 [Brasilonema octagenarum UFV-E1]